MKRILFLDRDGTILVEPTDNQQIDSVSKFAFLQGAITTISRIARELEFELVLVTNQDGLGTARFPREQFEVCQQLMVQILESEGVIFKAVLIDESFPEQKLSTRKPGLGLVQPYLSGDYDIANSFVIGDRLSDMEFARNMGAMGILLNDSIQDEEFPRVSDWTEVFALLRNTDRRCTVRRTTNETSISVSLNLDDVSRQVSNSGIPFLDHMITQIAKNAGIYLDLQAKGDLQIDEHHTVEDCAIALGDALKGCLGNKKGITRYGFVLPMDEALARCELELGQTERYRTGQYQTEQYRTEPYPMEPSQVELKQISPCALDLSGRAFLEWTVSLAEPSIGGITSSLFKHFFYSLCVALGATIHISASGENGHHIIESVFKCFGRALKQAIVRNGGGIPSSKGIL